MVIASARSGKTSISHHEINPLVPSKSLSLTRAVQQNQWYSGDHTPN